MIPLFDQTRRQLGDVMNPAAVLTLLRLPPDPVVHGAEVRTVGWPESWKDEVWCFKNEQLHGLMCSVVSSVTVVL